SRERIASREIRGISRRRGAWRRGEGQVREPCPIGRRLWYNRGACSVAAWRRASCSEAPRREEQEVPIRWVAGDLFANAYKVQAFAHGCNCQGSMGAGIAKGFRQRYPRMYEEYHARCKAQPRRFNLGDAWLWKDEKRPCVFNLGTQETYWRGRASYE